MVADVLSLLAQRRFEEAAAAFDEDCPDSRTGVVRELVYVGVMLPPPVLEPIVRVVRDQRNLAQARRPLARFRREDPDAANDLARYLAAHAPLLSTVLGRALVASSMPRAERRVLGITLASLAVGWVLDAWLFASPESPSEDPIERAVEMPIELCRGWVDTTVGPDRTPARLPTLRPCRD